MSIDLNLLLEYGGKLRAIPKKAFVFSQGEEARYYYQVTAGEIQMCNYSESGKIHIQGIFNVGNSFGEPPLFGDFKYPAHALAISDAEVVRLPKERFMQLLTDNPPIHLKITQVLAQRLFFKARLASEISMNPPEKRILGLLTHLKKEIYHITEPFQYEVKLTRQEIGDLTGLRVETVIRTVKQLEKSGELQIKNRKVWI